MTFYRMRGLYFRAYTIKDGNACMCEFLANNPCGFVEKNSNSSIFFQHKICKFQTKDEKKCVMKDKGNFLSVGEKGIGDTCMDITLDITGTCLKINNQLVQTELFGNSETQWLKMNGDAENSCLQVQLIGNATQFQIKTNGMCVVIKQYSGGDYKWLTFDPCDAYKPIYFTIP